MFYPYVDIFEPTGEGIVKYCSTKEPSVHCSMAESNFIHMHAAVQRAIDEGAITEADTYIVVITGKRPVKARQFVVIGRRGTLRIFAPTGPSPT
jgi:hypothetical protein